MIATATTAATDTVPLPAPQNLEESGNRLDQVIQILLKTLHFSGELSGLELAQRLGVGFPEIEPGIEPLKSQHLCEIVGGTNLGAPSYRYRITTQGRERASVLLESNKYVGQLPVPFKQYREYMDKFNKAVPRTATRADVRRAFSHLVLPQRVPDSYVKATVTERVEDRLPTISAQILSRSRLEQIIEAFELVKSARGMK